MHWLISEYNWGGHQSPPPPMRNANQLFSLETLFLFMMFTFINHENFVRAVLGVYVIGYVCNIDI